MPAPHPRSTWLSGPTKRPPNPESIKETFAFIRTHSTIRFVALPVFLTAIGVLAETFYTKHGIPRLVTAGAGALLSALACVFEVVLSRNLIAWWGALERTPGFSSNWPAVAAHRHEPSLKTVRWALFLPYPVSLAFWLDHLAYHFLCRSFGNGPTVQWLSGLVALLVGGAAIWGARRTWIAAEPKRVVDSPRQTM